MSLIHALVARESTILAENRSGKRDFSTAVSTILSKIPPNNSKLTYVWEQYLFHYVSEDGLTFLVMADDAAGRRMPFAFIADLQRRFTTAYSRDQIEDVPAYGLNEFSATIGKLIEQYNTAPPVDALSQAQQDLAQVKDIMVHNVEQILSRGERIELLVDKTDNMATQSHAFRRGARTVRRQQFWRNQRIVALSVFVGFLNLRFISLRCEIHVEKEPEAEPCPAMAEPVHRIGQKTAGAWGLHTATIDWCEDNYTHTHYVAEWYNTISNIPFILLGLFGAYSCLAPHLQPNNKPIPDGRRHAAGNLGIMFIGFGSAIFHATLKWHAQVLLDELPMIFVTSLVLYLVCADEDRWKGQNAWKLKVGLAAVPLSVSAIYLYYPNPVLHQVCFGLIQLTSTYRTVLLFKTAPASVPPADLRAAKHYILTGSLLFVLAFGIWNVDNVWCDTWTSIRARSSWFGSEVVWAVTQGHAWWHLLTGLGCARIGVGTSYLMISRKYPGAFELTAPVWGLVPSMRWRVSSGKGGGMNGNAKMDKLQ
ncbi:unnamed protein product [Rhizoctonia solani]|uniref:Synaptobrevin homolog YKT6 n=1 Tax=Rhizoctonia solani TaxID=456999 RepID=A0A8H3GK91_9AGAM|nr:unnamed protein product [Rhizoctonia solani]